MSKKRKDTLGVTNTYSRNSQKNSMISQQNSMSNQHVKNGKVTSQNKVVVNTVKASDHSDFIDKKKPSRLSKLKILKESTFNWMCLILIMISTVLIIVSQISAAPNGVLLVLAALFGISVLISILMPLVKLTIVKNDYLDKKTVSETS